VLNHRRSEARGEDARSQLNEVRNQPQIELLIRVALGYVYMAISLLPQDADESRIAVKLARQAGNQKRLRVVTGKDMQALASLWAPVEVAPALRRLQAVRGLAMFRPAPMAASAAEVVAAADRTSMLRSPAMAVCIGKLRKY